MCCDIINNVLLFERQKDIKEMGIVVGIDIGGSTTKIAGFDEEKMLKSVQISASNAIASLFGAFGKFLYDNE